MGAFSQVTRSDFFIKLKSWEYWPFGILQFPSIIYFLWLAIRSRSLVFFSASNPGIAMGGMFGESKFEVLSKLPSAVVPLTVLVKVPTTTAAALSLLNAKGLSFPVIMKPDIGERGFRVKRILDRSDFENYVITSKHDFIIQELVDLPMEFGVFYHRHPNESAGRVTSVVMKEMLTVTGDGRSSLQTLILQKDRAKLQWTKLREKYADRLSSVLAQGEVIELVSIGNHALGTKFLNGNHLISDAMNRSFDRISKSIDGFYFGRFDLRCASVEDLIAGNVKVVELNGCGAEPAHIYDPDFKLVDAVVVLLKHWRAIFEIARENHKMGASYISLKEGIAYYKRFKEATRP